jgi:hypothetical protein
MKKSKGMPPWFIIVITAILIFLLAVPVGAGNQTRKLYGEYSTNFIQSCGTCSVPFTISIPFAPVCSSGISTNYLLNAQSVFTFDGKGKVAFRGRYLSVLRNPIPIPNTPAIIPVVLPQKLICEQGTYKVFDDLTFEAVFEPCFVYGNEQDLNPIHRITNFNLRGQILDRMDGPVLLLTDTFDPDPAFSVPTPNIETVITFPPLAQTVESYRICGLIGTAIPVKEQRMRAKE